MKQIYGFLFGLVFGMSAVAATTPQPWAFVVSVGGIGVGDPVRAGRRMDLAYTSGRIGFGDVHFQTHCSPLGPGLLKRHGQDYRQQYLFDHP